MPILKLINDYIIIELNDLLKYNIINFQWPVIKYF